MKNDAEKAAAQARRHDVFADAQNDSSKQAATVENFVGPGRKAIPALAHTGRLARPAIEAAVKGRHPGRDRRRKANPGRRAWYKSGADKFQAAGRPQTFIVTSSATRAA